LLREKFTSQADQKANIAFLPGPVEKLCARMPATGF
jgi:hypothetical protein